jgi:hypothetical protein
MTDITNAATDTVVETPPPPPPPKPEPAPEEVAFQEAEADAIQIIQLNAPDNQTSEAVLDDLTRSLLIDDLQDVREKLLDGNVPNEEAYAALEGFAEDLRRYDRSDRESKPDQLGQARFLAEEAVRSTKEFGSGGETSALFGMSIPGNVDIFSDPIRQAGAEFLDQIEQVLTSEEGDKASLSGGLDYFMSQLGSGAWTGAFMHENDHTWVSRTGQFGADLLLDMVADARDVGKGLIDTGIGAFQGDGDKTKDGLTDIGLGAAGFFIPKFLEKFVFDKIASFGPKSAKVVNEVADEAEDANEKLADLIPLLPKEKREEVLQLVRQKQVGRLDELYAGPLKDEFPAQRINTGEPLSYQGLEGTCTIHCLAMAFGSAGDDALAEIMLDIDPGKGFFGLNILGLSDFVEKAPGIESKIIQFVDTTKILNVDKFENVVKSGNENIKLQRVNSSQDYEDELIEMVNGSDATIATVNMPNGDLDYGPHAVVLDKVYESNGIRMIEFRDPRAGEAYAVPLDNFYNYFDGYLASVKSAD